MSRLQCEYPGRYKVVYGYNDNVSSLFCSAHADDWMRQLGGRRVEPRNVTGEELPCAGDWVIPGMVPGAMPDETDLPFVKQPDDQETDR